MPIRLRNPGQILSLLLLGTGLLFAAGCETSKGTRARRARLAAPVDPSADSQELLRRGDAALKGSNYVDAEKLYEAVRRKYPFLEASKMAELRLADTDFNRELYMEARDRYQNFAKLHPTHPKVDYAAFRVALSHFKQMPSDFFLLPPSHEKDQVDVRGASKAAAEFLKLYPSSSFVPEAQKILAKTQLRLAQHDLYVADFYAKRMKWPAVVQRLEGLEERFPEAGVAETSLFKLHHAYVQLKDASKAEETLKRIIRVLPNSPASERAQSMLAGR